ncbi:MAG: DUF4430 domain-containing protein [Thermoleophilia bacterium]
MHNRRLVRAALALLIAAMLLAGTGCERRSTRSAAAPATTATLLVTSDLGASVEHRGTVAADGSVLDALRAATDVRTAYGGGFVSEMFGLRSDAGGRRDWIYWVNGRLAERGARDVRVRAGDHVWWDYQRWSPDRELRAVVGAWPAPFADLETVAADPPVAGWLRGRGVRVVPTASWRVRVGGEQRLRRADPEWARANDAGRLPASISDGAARRLGADGESMVAVPGGAAVAVALPGADDGVTLVIAGRDDATARRAATTVVTDPRVLAGHVAVVFDADGASIAVAGEGS